MHSFLGVPIMIRGRAWGNMYLTEKRIGDFNDADEYAAVTLATWAAIAIDHARLLSGAMERQGRLEAAVRRLEAAQAVQLAVGEEADRARVLELIAERGRSIVDGRGVLIMLKEGSDLVVAADAGDTEPQIGARVPIAGSPAGQVLETKRPARVSDPASHLLITPTRPGEPEARSALLVPLVYQGEASGVLAAFDRGPESPEFDDDDEHILAAFAASAATAVGQRGPHEQTA
jgi:GAF domain-containing protein